MHVTLVGSSPSTLTAGIMLLTRSRQLGYRLHVTILGDPKKIHHVPGPASVYAPVLASCGVGRDFGRGATVVVPGPPDAPVLATLTPHGVGGWFQVERNGMGTHPATAAYMRLCNDDRPEAQALVAGMRAVLRDVGATDDPSVLDVLFGAPVPPLLRIAVALRHGRSLSGARPDSLMRWMTGSMDDAQDPIAPDTSLTELIEGIQGGRYDWILARLSPSIREAATHWLTTAAKLATDDGARDEALIVGIAELLSHLCQLPVDSILPPLGAAEDAVAMGLAGAMNAYGDGDAAKALHQTYRFLGGGFSQTRPGHTICVSDEPEPEPGDVIASWEWFCREVRVGRKRADAIWEDLYHPAQ